MFEQLHVLMAGTSQVTDVELVANWSARKKYVSIVATTYKYSGFIILVIFFIYT